MIFLGGGEGGSSKDHFGSQGGAGVYWGPKKDHMIFERSLKILKFYGSSYFIPSLHWTWRGCADMAGVEVVFMPTSKGRAPFVYIRQI